MFVQPFFAPLCMTDCRTLTEPFDRHALLRKSAVAGPLFIWAGQGYGTTCLNGQDGEIVLGSGPMNLHGICTIYAAYQRPFALDNTFRYCLRTRES